MGQEPVIAAARSNGLTGSIGVSFENNTCIVAVFTEEREIIADILRETVGFHQPAELHQALDRIPCLGMHLLREETGKLFFGRYKPGSLQEKIPGGTVKSPAAQKFFCRKIILA